MARSHYWDDGFGRAETRPVPDVAAPLLGWRGWRVARSGDGELRLASWVVAEIWPPAGLRASCRCPEFRGSSGIGDAARPTGPRRHRLVPGRAHPARWQPQLGYGCGIYGMRSYGDYLGSDWEDLPVHGAAYLGGRVWPHEGGWRAEHARVACLVNTLDTQMWYLHELAEQYGVPVLGREQVEQFASEGNERWPR